MRDEGGADPIAIGKLAVRRGLLKEADLRESVQHLARLSFDLVKEGDGGRLPTLTDVLLERKLLSGDQVRDLEAELARPVRPVPSPSPSAAVPMPDAFETTRRQPSPLAGVETTKKQQSPLAGIESPDEMKTKLQAPAGSSAMPPGGELALSVAPGGLPRPPTSSVKPITRSVSAAGRSFGRYMLVRELGRGGMSVVWEAYDTDLRRRVAIKFLTGVGGRYIDAAQEEILKRFYREAHSAAKLSHPNIVKIFEVGELDGQHYIAMEYVDGQTLYDLVMKKKVDMRQIVQALRDAAHAIHHAHRNGILHRDIKPQNIMIDGSGHTYIMDFGLARDMQEDQRLTLSGIAIGTPNYMPPEHAQGSKNVIDVRSDVYSMGAVLYEMLAGRPPFPGETPMAVMLAVVNQDPARPSQIRAGVSGDLETICLKAMQKDKERRYPSALALADDLDRWLRGEPVRARPPSFVYAATRRLKRYAVPLAALAAAALVASGWFIYAQREARVRRQAVADEIARAQGLVQKGDYAGAVTVLEAALKLGAGADAVRRDLDAAREKLDEQKRAEERRRREEQRQAEVKQAYQTANDKYQRGEQDTAREGFDRVLALDPRHADALHHRGKISFLQHKDDAALADWERALEARPAFPCVICDIAGLWRRKGDRVKAREYFKRAMDVDASFDEAPHQLGHMAQEDHDYEAAEACFTQAIKAQRQAKYFADRGEVRALAFCAGGHRDEQKITEALRDSETALGLEKAWTGYYSRGLCYSERREYQKAITDLETALQLSPNNKKVQTLLQSARQKAKEPQ